LPDVPSNAEITEETLYSPACAELAHADEVFLDLPPNQVLTRKIWPTHQGQPKGNMGGPKRSNISCREYMISGVKFVQGAAFGDVAILSKKWCKAYADRIRTNR